MGLGLFAKVFKKKSFKDPVCGMGATDEITTEHNGQKYYFCSEHCRQQFIDNPRGFVKDK